MRRGLLHPMTRCVLFALLCFPLLEVLPELMFRELRILPEGVRQIVAYVLLDAAILGSTWLFLQALDRSSFRTVGLWFYPGWARELVQGIGVGAGLIAVAVAILVVARGVVYHGLAARLGGTALLRIAGVALFLLLAAGLEELVFRGYGFQRLVDAVGPLAAVLIFSAIFGAAHLGNPSATALSTANTVLSGLLLSMAYLRTRALWLPIGLHWAWNFAMGPIFSLPVSGINLPAQLLRADSTGARWLTGGSYGPEGGVVVGVVCMLVTLWLARTRRLHPSPGMQEVLQ